MKEFRIQQTSWIQEISMNTMKNGSLFDLTCSYSTTETPKIVPSAFSETQTTFPKAQWKTWQVCTNKRSRRHCLHFPDCHEWISTHFIFPEQGVACNLVPVITNTLRKQTYEKWIYFGQEPSWQVGNRNSQIWGLPDFKLTQRHSSALRTSLTITSVRSIDWPDLFLKLIQGTCLSNAHHVLHFQTTKTIKPL